MFLATIQEIESSINQQPDTLPLEVARGGQQKIEVVTLYNISEQREQAKKQFQSQIISQLALERKNKNYDELKQWDQQRSVKLAMHRKAIEQLANRIEQKLRNSEDYFTNIQRFFAEKAQQYKKYASHLLSNPSLEGQINLLSSKLYGSTNKVISRCHQSSVALQKKYKEIADNINTKIVHIMEKMTNQMEVESIVMKERLSTMTSELQYKNQQLSQQGTFLAGQFYKTKNSFSAGIDFYIQQHSFIKRAKEQTNLQKKMAKEVLGYLDYAITSELARSIQLKDFVEAYANIIEDNYQRDLKAEAIFKAKEDQQIQITKFYEFQELIDHSLELYIRQALGLKTDEPLHLLQLRTFLNSLQFQDFDCGSLALKEFVAYHKHHENDFSPIVIMVTVDGFMHLYEKQNSEQNTQKQNPQFVFKLHPGVTIKQLSQIQIQIQCTSSQTVLDYLARIPAKQGGFAFNIYFLSEQKKNEFIQFMSKIVN